MVMKDVNQIEERRHVTHLILFMTDYSLLRKRFRVALSPSQRFVAIMPQQTNCASLQENEMVG